MVQPPSPLRLASPKPLRWPFAFLGAATATLIALIVTPAALSDIAESRRLELDPIAVTGHVVGHQERTGKSRCNSSARVLYVVNGRMREVPVAGCGAIPERLPLGTPVPVVHVRTDPDIAHAEAPGASTARWGLSGLIGVWLVTGGLAAYAWLSWARRPAVASRKPLV